MVECPSRTEASFLSLVAGVGLLTLGTWIGPTWEGIVFDALGMASLVVVLAMRRAFAQEDVMLRRILASSIFAASVSLAGAAFAQAPSAAPDCAARATEKKLHGAALNSFLKKCERDAAASTCDAAAVEKKLHGAAKTSFTKKCVKDATAKPSAQ